MGGGDVGQVLFECANIGIDGHAVVVQNDQHVGVFHAAVVQPFKGQTSGHGPIANHSHVLCAAFAIVAAAHGHAQRRTDARAAVAHAKGVVGALAPLGESREAFVLAVGVEVVATPCQNLVAIGLVPHIPNDLVLRGVERIVQGNRQLNHPQTRPKMSALFRHHIDDELPELIGHLLKFFCLEFAPQIGGVLNL